MITSNILDSKSGLKVNHFIVIHRQSMEGCGILPRLVGYDQLQLNTICFENSTWRLVNIGTSFFLAAGGIGKAAG